MTTRALFISPAFFGYEGSIRDALQEHGFIVDFVDERPSNRSLARVVVRVLPRLAGPMVRRYYTRLERKYRERRYDLVFVIKGEVVPREFLESIKRGNPDARFVFYSYDSLVNSPHCVNILDVFDERFSFDPQDVARRTDLRYKPLFYTHEFEAAGSSHERKFSLSFVGTLHSARYRIAKTVSAKFNSSYTFFYVPARWYYLVARATSAAFRDVSPRDVQFVPLTRQEVAAIFQQSEAVLDIQRDEQVGLTMRTFEVLAAGAILVTTNPQIREEPFYSSDWVVVIPSDVRRVYELDLVRAVQDRASRQPLVDFDEHRVDKWLRDIIGTDSL